MEEGHNLRINDSHVNLINLAHQVVVIFLITMKTACRFPSRSPEWQDPGNRFVKNIHEEKNNTTDFMNFLKKHFWFVC